MGKPNAQEDEEVIAQTEKFQRLVLFYFHLSFAIVIGTSLRIFFCTYFY